MIPEHVVGFWCFVAQVLRFLVMAISAGLTHSASHHQADVEGGDQVFTDLQGRSCKQYMWGLAGWEATNGMKVDLNSDTMLYSHCSSPMSPLIAHVCLSEGC